MTEKKQKRYPTDRLKLHALLKKKEKELVRLREEVDDIRKLVQQADATAINATELPKGLTESDGLPDEKEDSIDDENA